MIERMEVSSTGEQLSLGVDVGGTNTDAVVLDPSHEVIAHTKQPTTDDVTGGIRAAITTVLADLGGRRRDVTRVMMGTTHATNAIVRRKDLGRVAVIRLGAPASSGYPPLIAWPVDLRNTVLAGSALLPGGHMVDGTPISDLDHEAVRGFLRSLEGPIDAVAVCGIFSPSFPDQEVEVEAIVHATLGKDIPVSLSRDVGAIGLLERENATVLNAALYGVASGVTRALLNVVEQEGLVGAMVYFAQNDGTLMALEFAERYPVLTIGSGPANSIRGAALLADVDSAIVVDVGGTTSDLGVVTRGFPRESSLPREIGGVRTNFRMPDVLSIAVGGGTRIEPSTGRLGPDSLGHRLTSDALAFGGAVATLTDAAILMGRAGGDLAELSVPNSPALSQGLRTGLERAHERLEQSVERLSSGRVDVPLVVVGGGAFLVPDDLPGVGTVIRPEHGDVANAVGAAMSLAGGRAQEISAYEDRDEAVARASQAAIDRAIEAGADPLRVEVYDILETPVSYSAQQTVRISAKAAGPLSILGSRSSVPSPN
ncbi:hydantoinase/oxoprolinase family protein [Brevibacterium sp. FME17]|uniref:hydantoinase/oxoprolinase family protein n=1 Tax=Brevibacterium sp. FME17 TaxID=2742606 RepID=UPI00299F8913|nr:hydantoinase/oxoprolinase family protein [Brevibacterium sp. FME17]